MVFDIHEVSLDYFAWIKICRNTVVVNGDNKLSVVCEGSGVVNLDISAVISVTFYSWRLKNSSDLLSLS